MGRGNHLRLLLGEVGKNTNEDTWEKTRRSRNLKIERIERLGKKILLRGKSQNDTLVRQKGRDPNNEESSLY